MGKHGKYKKTYRKDWESEPDFKHWLEETSEVLKNLGQPEAYCKICKCCIRPQKNDLKDHANTQKHRQAMSAVPTVAKNNQSTLTSHGFQVKSNQSKIIDLKLSVHVACHSSVRTVDHLGEVLTSVGIGSKLEQLKLHRTKCGKLICNVLAPNMLREMVDDIGENNWYSLIIDECTDNTALKVMGVMVKYHSHKNGRMMTDLLGLIETPRATHDVLYEALTGLLRNVGLAPCRCFSLGTDGGANLCGSHHSVYALMKKNDNPNLHLVKCICHGLDTSASKASGAIPGTVEFLLRESRSWFSHSAVRKLEYNLLYKDLTDGNSPPQLVKMGTTRWLSWYGAVKAHSAQYDQLKAHFRKVALADPRMDCPMAHKLAAMHDDGVNAVYLAFLKPVLKELASVNVTFQSSMADISKVYSDLQIFIFTIAKKFVKAEALVQGQPGMLRLTELQALQRALLQPQDKVLLPLELVKYGAQFWENVARFKVEGERLRTVQENCRNFLIRLTQDMVKRLPSCIEAVEKMRAFSPAVALSKRGRPEFRHLPLNFVQDSRIDLESMEMQWEKLANFPLEQLCPDESDVDQVHIVKFWTAVSKVTTAAGQLVFPELSRFVLAGLTIPLSNALVERLFSLLGIVKNKLRNRMLLDMLEAILRVRIHLQALGLCCNSFEPTKEMVENFNSKSLYPKRMPRSKAGHSDANLADQEFLVDDPEEAGPEPDMISTGFTFGDGDLDSNLTVIPEWDSMMQLVEQVDQALDGNF